MSRISCVYTGMDDRGTRAREREIRRSKCGNHRMGTGITRGTAKGWTGILGGSLPTDPFGARACKMVMCRLEEVFRCSEPKSDM